MTPGPAEFGLHRGRRALAAILAAGLLVWAGHALWPAAPPLPPPPPVVAIAAQPSPPPAPPRATPTKRRAKAARTGPSHAPARVEPAPAAVLPPPPPVPAPEPPEEETPAAPPVVEPEAEAMWDGNGESIARAIAAEKRAAVRLCFERELKQQPTLTGSVTVELDLAPPDRVNEVRVSDDLDRPAFTQCVASAMHEARFAALNEEVSVRVPYVLSPASVR